MPGPGEFNPRKTLIAGSVILGLIIWNALREAPVSPHVQWSGSTMGTSYRVVIPQNPLDAVGSERLRLEIEGLLDTFNQQMSTYIPGSEISRFNNATSGVPFAVSPLFANTVQLALSISAQTEGAFDITIAPLVELWGFGASGGVSEPPSDAAIAERLAHVGYQHLSADETQLSKAKPGLKIDLSALAKGAAVDEVGYLIRSKGIGNYYVEIGGEIVVSGRNPDGRHWRLGLEPPDYGSMPGEPPPLGVLSLNGGGKERRSPARVTTGTSSRMRARPSVTSSIHAQDARSHIRRGRQRSTRTTADLRMHWRRRSW